MPKEKLQQIAAQIEQVFYQQGHPELRAQPQRGHVVVKVNEEVLARYTCGGGNQLHLSYRNHNGKWEPMPFAAQEPGEAARLVLQILMPHIQALSSL